MKFFNGDDYVEADVTGFVSQLIGKEVRLDLKEYRDGAQAFMDGAPFHEIVLAEKKEEEAA